MASNPNEMLQEIVDKTYDEKATLAKAVLSDCFDILKNKGFDDEETTMTIVAFLTAAIASDGQFTAPERQLLNDMIDGDLDQLVRSTDRKTYELMDRIVDMLDSTSKNKFCLLAILVMAVDDSINRDELTYLAKLMQ